MNHSERQAIIKAGVEGFMKNPAWKEEYDKAPTVLCKLRANASFVKSWFWQDEAIAARFLKIDKRLERSFTSVEWGYLLQTGAGATAKIYWKKRWLECLEKEKEKASKGTMWGVERL